MFSCIKQDYIYHCKKVLDNNIKFWTLCSNSNNFFLVFHIYSHTKKSYSRWIKLINVIFMVYFSQVLSVKKKNYIVHKYDWYYQITLQINRLVLVKWFFFFNKGVLPTHFDLNVCHELLGVFFKQYSSGFILLFVCHPHDRRVANWNHHTILIVKLYVCMMSVPIDKEGNKDIFWFGIARFYFKNIAITPARNGLHDIICSIELLE